MKGRVRKSKGRVPAASPLTNLVAVKPFSEPSRDYTGANVVLTGVPLDSTASFRKGCKFAPKAVRNISWHLEDYSLTEGRNILSSSFCDVGDLRLTGTLERNLSRVKELVQYVALDGKKPLLLGGEHLITYPAVEALVERYPKLRLVIFDAHTDLGDHHRGLRLSHAGVTRLLFDLLGAGRICLFGTRSGCREDLDILKRGICHSQSPPSPSTIEMLRGHPLYVSVDADVLDPCAAPGVSTPELLGWSYADLAGALDMLEPLGPIVGADVVEICPPFDPGGVTSLIGASVVRKLIWLMDKP